MTFDDAYEKTPEMFGHPYQELQDFFLSLPRGRVLDLGCGQGRDALFLARVGFTVTAVDSSAVGINQMLRQDGSIEGVVADITKYLPEGPFDVLLCDMVLHSFELDVQRKLLDRWKKSLSQGGFFCLVFPSDAEYKDVLGTMNIQKEIVVKDVPKMPGEKNDFTFIMLIVTP